MWDSGINCFKDVLLAFYVVIFYSYCYVCELKTGYFFIGCLQFLQSDLKILLLLVIVYSRLIASHCKSFVFKEVLVSYEKVGKGIEFFS